MILGGFKATPFVRLIFLICWYGFQLGIDPLRCEKVFRFHCFLKTSQPLFIFQVKGFQIGKQLRKAVSPRNSGSIRWRYFILGGFKQTVYFDTGRLQGYPLCEMDFFNLLIAFSIRDWSKIGYPQNWLPPKKIGYPQKNGYPKKLIKKNTPKILAYFIARGVIIEFWENAILYFVGVY